MKLNKGAIWVSAGILAGAGIGTGIGFLVLDLHKKYDAEPTHPSEVIDKIEANAINPITIQEFDSGIPERQSLLDDNGLALLNDKIKRRLGFGPEVGLLKSIYIQKPNKNWTDSNGVYFGSTNEIFINSQSMWDAWNKAVGIMGLQKGDSNYDAVMMEFLSEEVFQVIYHEYGHHIAYVYLNSRKNADDISKVTVKGKDEGSTNTYEQNWDKTFYSDFTKALNYDGSKPHINKQVAPFVANGQTYYSIADGRSAQNLFEFANLPTKNVLEGIDGKARPMDDNLKYSMFGNYGTPTVIFKQESIKYHWSMSEIFTRKMQQATMPLENKYSDAIETLKKQSPSTWERLVYGMNQTTSNEQETRGTFSPWSLDLSVYADRTYDHGSLVMKNYFDDYLFPTEAGQTNNAESIYKSLTKIMGFESGDDISAMWWQNDSVVSGDGTLIYPKATNSIKFGGYVSDKNLNSIGYLDEKGTFIPLSSITTNNFNYQVKTSIFGERPELDASKDKVYYTTDKYLDINSLKGKNLVFAHLETPDELARRVVMQTKKVRMDNTQVVNTSRAYINITPLTTINTKATTFLSQNSQGENNGINSKVAHGIKDANGVRIEVM